MSRPIYEQAGDREREKWVAEHIAAMHGLTAVEMPRLWGFDYAFVDGLRNIKAIVEVKCRTYDMDAFATYMLSAKKLSGLLDMGRNSAVSVLLAVQWSDHLGLLALPAPHHLKIGGRKDRGDQRDIEPVVHFETRLFRIIT